MQPQKVENLKLSVKFLQTYHFYRAQVPTNLGFGGLIQLASCQQPAGIL